MPADPSRAVFLSYASQDAGAVRRICETLRAVGVEVWLDQDGGLVGGDAWDAKIRKQIASCALFVPVISANTQARREGYFRLEWKLAAQRTHMMSERTTFLLPVVIDETRDAEADVPAEFRAVQWIRLPASETSAAFCERIKFLLGGEAASGEPSPTSHPPSPEKSMPARKPRGKIAAALVAVVVLLVALGGWRWWRDRSATESPTGNSIAVLPFVNLSPDKAGEYFSDGISEEICGLLGRVPGLRVSASASSFHFKGKSMPPAEIARQLNVTHLVDGSVQKDGDRLRVRARLIHARDGIPLWVSENYDREIKDIFKIQDEIAGLIARNLRRNLQFTFSTHRTTPEAYQAYLQGRQAWSLRGGVGEEENEELMAEAKRWFETAIRLDPKFGRAYAGLVDAEMARFRWGRFGVRSAPELMELVLLAEKAIELDPHSAEGHIARAAVYYRQWNFVEAERTVRRAIGLNANYADGYYLLARLLELEGRMAEALQEFARAIAMDPLTPRVVDNYRVMLQRAGRHSAALAILEKNTTTNASAKVRSLLALERAEEAWELVKESRRPRTVVPVLMALGRRAEAEKMVEQRAVQSPYGDFELWAMIGRHEQAMAALQADDVSTIGLANLLFADVFDPLRKDPRFIGVLAALGATESHARAQAWRAAHPPEKPSSPRKK